MKKLVVLILLLSCIFMFCGCGQTENTETIQVTDMSGAVVTIPKNPQKIAAVSPSTGDLLIAFGLGDKLDGTYYSVMNNPWAEKIYPQSEEFFGYNYDNSVEAFLERGVDLVLIPEPSKAEELRKHGVNALCVRQFDECGYGEYIFYFSEIVRQIWGDEVSDKVDMWQEGYTNAIEEVSSVIENSGLERRSLYYICGDKYRGLGYTDLGGSLLECVYDEMNIEFICKNFESNRPSVEAVLEINPDIITIGGVYQQRLKKELFETETWKELDAVKNNQVYNIPVAFVSFEQTAAETPLFIYDTANKLYPELFDYDMNALTKEYMQKYFGCELTDQEVSNILAGLDENGEALKWDD